MSLFMLSSNARVKTSNLAHSTKIRGYSVHLWLRRGISEMQHITVHTQMRVGPQIHYACLKQPATESQLPLQSLPNRVCHRDVTFNQTRGKIGQHKAHAMHMLQHPAAW